MRGDKTALLEALVVAEHFGRLAAGGSARSSKEGKVMRHSVNVELGGTTKREKVIGIKSVKIRERIMRFLFGTLDRYAVIVPGSSVETLTITEKQPISDEDMTALLDAVQRHPAGSRLAQNMEDADAGVVA